MKRQIALFIFSIILCGSAIAYDFSAVCSNGQTLFYNIISDTLPYTVEVTKETSSYPYYSNELTGVVEIPESVEYNEMTYSVTSIGDSAFCYCRNMTSIIIPNSVTNIGDKVFYYCTGLSELTIPYSVDSIGMGAFSECRGLTEITVHENMTSIGKGAFAYCSGLTTVNFNATNCTYMGYGDSPVFSYCTALATLNIGERVTSIPPFAFYGCSGLAELTIPDNVTSIGNSAFAKCSGLVEVTIHEGITYIGTFAFYQCYGLMTLNFNAVNCTYMGTSGQPPFSQCTSLSTLNIGENVTFIPEYAFRLCDGVATINYNATNCSTMTSTYAGLTVSAFYDCSSLSTLNIGDNVESIPEKAFQDCPIVGALVLPNSVVSIGYSAFGNCDRLTEVTIPSSVTSIGEYAFSHCDSLTTVNFNAINCADMPLNVFVNNNAFSTLNIGENVTKIPANAFYECYSLTEVIIPNLVTSIGRYAFRDCTSLSSVTIPSSVTHIYNGAFTGCSGLVECHYMGDVAGWCGITIGNVTANPFYWAQNQYIGEEPIIDLIIPESVFEIMPFVFYGISSITTVTFPESISSIGDHAFYDCSGLTTVNFNAINCSMMGDGNYSVFYNCTSLSTLNIGGNVTSIPYDAFRNCDNIIDINVYSSTPPTIASSSVFESAVYSNATVWTPCPAATNYRNDSRWGQFANIRNEQTTIYNIAVQTADANMGDVSGDGSFTCDTEVELIATPNDGYRFLSWNDGNEDNPRTITVGGDSTFVASFRAVHTITASAGEHGSISPSGDVTVDEAADQSFTITPDTYYRIASVIVDGQTDVTAQLVDGVYTFVNVMEDHTISATFENIPYTIEVAVNNDELGSVSGGGTYNAGTEISITATPNDGYHFVSWNDANTDNPRTLIVTSDSTFVATFVRNQFTIIVLSSDSNGGSVTGEGIYPEGDTATLTATPSIGYCFVSWSDGNTDNPRMVEVVQDSTFVAEFSATMHRAVDTTVTSYLSVDEHTFYVSGVYSYVIPSDIGCDTIVDLTLQVLDEPEVFEISPNPAKSLICISLENYISSVEIYSTTGKLVLRKEIHANRAEMNVEWLVPGVYFIRMYGEDGGQPSVQRFVKE